MADQTNNVIFLLEADASGAIDALTNVISALEELQSVLDSIGGSVGTLDSLDTALVAAGEAATAIGTAAQEAATGVQTLADGMTQTASGAATMDDALASVSSGLSAIDSATTTAADATATLAAEYDTLAPSLFSAVSASDAAAIAIDNLVNSGDSELLAMQEMIDFNMQFIDSTTAVGTAAAEAATGVQALSDELALGVEAATAAADAYLSTANAMAGLGPASGAAMAGMTAIGDGLSLGTANGVAYADQMAAASVAEEEAAASGFSFSGMLGGLGGALGGAVGGVRGFLDTVAGLAPHMSYMSFILAMVGFKFIQMGTQAQDAMQRLAGFAGVGPQLMAQLDPALQKLALDLGVTVKGAADAAYYVISSGFTKLPDIITLTSLSLKDAASSGTDFATATRALTSMMIAYNIPASGAAKLNDELVRTVVNGAQSYQQMADSIGYFGAAVRNDGVTPLEALTAEAVVTLTSSKHLKTGLQEVTHLYEQVGLQSDALANRVKGLGISFNEAQFKQLPMIDKLKYLAAISAGDVIPATRAATEALSQQTIKAGMNTSKFEALVGGTTSLKGALLLLGDGGKHYVTIMGNIANGTSNMANSFKGQQQDMSAGWQHIAAGLSVFSYNLIKAASPILVPMMTALGNAIGFVGTHMQQFMPIILSVGAALAGALGAAGIGIIAGLLMGLLTPAGAVMVIFMGMGVVIANWGRIWGAIGSTVMSVVHQVMGVFLALAGAAAVVGMVMGIQLVTKVLAFATVMTVQATMAVIRFIPTLIGMLPMIFANTVAFAGMAVAVIAATWPLILIGVGIALLIAGFLVLWNRTTVVQQVLSHLGAFLQQFGATLMSDLQPAFKAIQDAFHQVVQALQPLIAAFKQAEPIFIIFGAAVGVALAIAFGVIIGVIRGLVGALGALIGGIARIIAGIIMIFVGFATFIVNIVLFVQEALQGHWGKAFAALGAAMQGLLMVVRGVWQVIANVIMTPLRMVAAFIGGFVHGIVQFFTWLWHTLVGGSIVPDMINGIIRWFHILIQVIVIVASFVMAIIQAFLRLVSTVISAIAGFIANIIAAWNRFVMTVLSAVMNFVNGVINLFHSLHGNVFQIIGQLVSGLVNLFLQLVSRVVSAVLNLVSQVLSGFTRMGTQIISGVASFIGNVVGKFTDLVGKIGGIIGGLAGQMFDWGAHAVQQLASGIASAAGAVAGAIGNIVGGITSHLHFSKPEEGPLKDIDTWMPHMGDLLSEGLTAQTGKVRTAALTVATSIAGASPQPGAYLPGRGVGSSSGSSGSPDVVSALTSILRELQQFHRPSSGASIGYSPLSNVVGTISSNTGTSGGSANIMAGLYQQLNMLAGRANENAKRGAGAGLGI